MSSNWNWNNLIVHSVQDVSQKLMNHHVFLRLFYCGDPVLRTFFEPVMTRKPSCSSCVSVFVTVGHKYKEYTWHHKNRVMGLSPMRLSGVVRSQHNRGNQRKRRRRHIQRLTEGVCMHGARNTALQVYNKSVWNEMATRAPKKQDVWDVFNVDWFNADEEDVLYQLCDPEESSDDVLEETCTRVSRKQASQVKRTFWKMVSVMTEKDTDCVNFFETWAKFHAILTATWSCFLLGLCSQTPGGQCVQHQQHSHPLIAC